MKNTHHNIDLSVILPCRNEELSIRDCILKTQNVFKKNHLSGEIIVSDSSSDRSPKIAASLGVIIVKHNKKGYGFACQQGIARASGTYIFIADPDSSYDFAEIPRFYKFLKKNYDFVIGNRLNGSMEKDAMPWIHRYLGNPLLTYALKILFKVKIGDAHCGMRAIKKESFNQMGLRSKGWEFAQDMVIAAKIANLRTKELSINYLKRRGQSKLHSFTDGIWQILFIFHRAFKYYKNSLFHEDRRLT